MNPIQLNPITLSYLAGVFDSEGCIVIENYKKLPGRMQPRVRVGNCDSRIPFLLKKFYGGTVCLGKRKSLNPKWHDYYSWSTVARKSLVFLRGIYPYMLLKTRQVELVFEFYEKFKNMKSLSSSERKVEIDRRCAIAKEISILNRGGDLQ